MIVDGTAGSLEIPYVQRTSYQTGCNWNTALITEMKQWTIVPGRWEMPVQVARRPAWPCWTRRKGSAGVRHPLSWRFDSRAPASRFSTVSKTSSTRWSQACCTSTTRKSTWANWSGSLAPVCTCSCICFLLWMPLLTPRSTIAFSKLLPTGNCPLAPNGLSLLLVLTSSSASVKVRFQTLSYPGIWSSQHS